MRETLISFIEDCVVRGKETAVVHWRGLRVSKWSYARLAQCAFQFARELEARDIGYSDRVLFWSENRPEWIAAFFGCLLRGAVVVPLDVKSAPDFARTVQQQVSAKLLLSEESNLEMPRFRLSDLPDVVGRHSRDPYTPEIINGTDLVEIVFTSGTTAQPKGVCLTHRNLLANLTPIEKEFSKYARWERLVHPLRFLCLLPLSHVFGQMMSIFVSNLVGGEVYFRESYKPTDIIEVVKRQRINVIVTVPRVLETLKEKVEHDYFLSTGSFGKHKHRQSQLIAAGGRHFARNWWTFREIHRRFGWRFWAFISGGATLESDTETFWRRLGFAVIQGYGMTETASLTSLSHPFRIVRGSIGKPVAGHEMKLADSGEILVRGDNVSPGYWGGGSDSSMTDEQGWIHTGDLGELGPKGHIYFRGRSKDTIVTPSGLKIYPADVEAALDREPEIKASTVVSIEVAKGVEAVAALIPSNEDSDLDAAVKRANESLSEFQRIRRWVQWPESDFPRTAATRKVIRRVVAETVRTILLNKPATEPSKSNTVPFAIASVVSRIAGVQRGTIESSARLADDLKLDSLGRVELLSALEDNYQIELDEAALSEATTIGEIDRMIREEKAEAVRYPYPDWAMHFPMTWIRPVVYHLLLLPITMIMCRVRIIGREQLIKLRGPAVLVSNHVTDVDAALIISALPLRWRLQLAIAMDGERLRNFRYPSRETPWFSRLRLKLQYALVAGLFNVFSLPKRSGFRRSFSYVGTAMDSGWSILIFPEGEETKDGNLQTFRAGIGLLAAELNVPIIPIKLDGLFELKRRRHRFVKPGAVTVTFGDAVKFAANTTPVEITRELELRVRSL